MASRVEVVGLVLEVSQVPLVVMASVDLVGRRVSKENWARRDHLEKENRARLDPVVQQVRRTVRLVSVTRKRWYAVARAPIKSALHTRYR